ncbi:hypothetical protein JCM17961_25090 [Endothiovibrio diazotrophicus]
MDRAEILRSWLKRDGIGLEIGPLHSPIAPKRDGWRVETFDHADAPTLRERYRESPGVDVAAIEEVDFVSDGRSLVEVVGETGRYDWILASHVVEHVPDLLGFLKDCETLLKPDGRLVLAVPDKRRCFDAMRPPSTTGEVLQAHMEGRVRHSSAAAFEYGARSVVLNGAHAWLADDCGEAQLQYDLATCYALFQRALASGEYHDMHGWVFIPSSFRLIAEELYQLELIRMREEVFRAGAASEFFFVLAKNGGGPHRSRQQIALDAVEEESSGLGALTAKGCARTKAVAELTASRQAAQERAEAAEAERQATEAALRATERALHDVQAALQAVRQSTSWRITGPLRRLVTLARGSSANERE